MLPITCIQRPFVLRILYLQRVPWVPKVLHYITLLFRINFPDYAIFLHYRIGFKLFPPSCNLLRYKAYHVVSGLHYNYCQNILSVM